MTEFNKRSDKTGYAPGAAIYVGDEKAHKTKITVIDYYKDKINIKELTSAKECEPFKSKPSVTWINIEGLFDINLITEIGKYYGIHPLSIEDMLNTEARPKFDLFDSYIFISFKLYSFSAKRKTLTVEQVSLILGENYVITVQEKAGDVFDSVRKRLQDNKSKIRAEGADYLMHALLDVAVDSYFAVLERLGDEITTIEEAIISDPNTAILKEIHMIKRNMIYLRKSIWPLREIISGLYRRISPLIKESTTVYLKDIYDHTIQVMDTVETYRDILAGMLDLYMSTVSNRMNDVMKVLTIFATIFIPLTFITGLYGMNFNTAISHFNMPELNWHYGYPFALGIMAVIAIVMLVFFKRKRWF